MDLSELTVSTSELAELLGVSTRRVRQLDREKRFEKVGRGRYALAGSIRTLFDHLSTTAAGRGEGVATLASARARLAEARAVQEERRNALESGAVIDADVACEVLGEVLIGVRRTVRNVPNLAPMRVPGFSLEMRKPLLALIDSALRSIASGEAIWGETKRKSVLAARPRAVRRVT